MLVFKGVKLASGETTDITVEGSNVTKVGKTKESGLDCSGLISLPGFVDLHTHLRQPGYEASETVLSGSRSGAAGGYTALFAMANSDPLQTMLRLLSRYSSSVKKRHYWKSGQLEQ